VLAMEIQQMSVVELREQVAVHHDHRLVWPLGKQGERPAVPSRFSWWLCETSRKDEASR
jgi:hypothetical protein